MLLNMVIIKKDPSDFKVRELIRLEYDKLAGNYAYYKLTKRNCDTLKAVELISKRLNVPIKFIGYAGNKDKYAETEQSISIPQVFRKRADIVRIDKIALEFLGCGKNRIHLGDNYGNAFEIKVYNYKKYHPSTFFINYFGEQRFGKDNHIIGKKSLKKENVYIDFKRKRFCLNAYQSYLWNKCINIYLENRSKKFKIGSYTFTENKIKNIKIPLINFDTKLAGKIGYIYSRLLEKEGITQKDFIIRHERNLISETVYRDLIVNVNNLKFKDDILKFTLPKGSYATVFIQNIFREPVIALPNS